MNICDVYCDPLDLLLLKYPLVGSLIGLFGLPIGIHIEFQWLIQPDSKLQFYDVKMSTKINLSSF